MAGIIGLSALAFGVMSEERLATFAVSAAALSPPRNRTSHAGNPTPVGQIFHVSAAELTDLLADRIAAYKIQARIHFQDHTAAHRQLQDRTSRVAGTQLTVSPPYCQGFVRALD